MVNLNGSIVALITPFTETGSIDWQSLENLIEFHIENSTNAISPCGTTGESPTLNIEEQISIIKFVVEKVKGRIPVLAGVGSNCTDEAVELTKRANKFGADAFLSIVPYYNKPTSEGLFYHFCKVASVCDKPIVLYNVPSRTSLDMMPSTVLKIAEKCSNVIALKEAVPDLSRYRELRTLLGNDFVLLSGEDSNAGQFLKEGGNGVISVVANFIPDKVSKLCSLALNVDQNKQKIDSLILELEEINKVLFIETNPIPVKYAVSKLGLCKNYLRLPLTKLNDKYISLVDNAINKFNYILKNNVINY